MCINEKTGKGWTDREEAVIAEIQHIEAVPRAEAIRRMRRRGLDDLKRRIRPLSEVIEEENVPHESQAVATPRKGGRPRKYRTDRERRVAERQQDAIRHRAYRKRRSVTENPLVSG